MYDCFIKIDGIDGESTDDKHAKWIEPLSYSFGASQAIGSAVSTGARSVGRVDLQDFSIVKELDSASCKLFDYCAGGKPIKKVNLELCRPDGAKQVFFKVDLEDVLVTSYQPSGQAGGTLPSESVTFNFAKITVTYSKSNHDTGKGEGDITASWDQALNKAG